MRLKNRKTETETREGGSWGAESKETHKQRKIKPEKDTHM